MLEEGSHTFVDKQAAIAATYKTIATATIKTLIANFYLNKKNFYLEQQKSF